MIPSGNYNRSGGCSGGSERGASACMSRIGPSHVRGLVKLLDSALSTTNSSTNLQRIQQCNPDVFYKMSSITRCVASGLHQDYSHVVNKSAKTIMRRPSVVQSKAFLLGTTLRDPIIYHHKLFNNGRYKFDVRICDLWNLLKISAGGGLPAAGGLLSGGNATSSGKDFNCDKNDGRVTTGLEGYMGFAHHRWNIFTRFIAGTILPNHFPHTVDVGILQQMHTQTFTRNHAIEQNNLGQKSPDYIAAVAHLEAMPHFSIFERMDESIELLCFTYCYNCTDLRFSYEPHKHPPLSETVRRTIGQYHKLDLLLYEHANTIFNKRVDWMRKAQTNGVQCDILLSGCALTCAA